MIVRTTLKRLDHPHLTLESLERLNYPAYEVLLVDNHVDGHKQVPAWLDRFPTVCLLTERRPGISAARTRGLAAATGDLIAFTDDDVTLDPEWLRAIAGRSAAHPEEVCVTGLVLPRELEMPAQIRLELYYGGTLGRAPRRPRWSNSRRRACRMRPERGGWVLVASSRPAAA